MNTRLDDLIEVLKAKGEALGDALSHEQQLEDDRAAIKADAIVRVMARENLAATPAEKIVETDEQYFRHRAAQRASIVARFRAQAEYEAAKARVTQASLITPSMIEMVAERDRLGEVITAQQKVITELTQQVRVAKRETDLKHIALRKANGYLADRIRDVDELTRINRNLSEQLNTEPREVPPTLDSLEQSRESLTATPYPAEATA